MMDDAACPYRTLWNGSLQPLLAGRFPRATSTLSHPQTVRARILLLLEQQDVATACSLASLVRRVAYADHLGDLRTAEASAILLGGESRRPGGPNPCYELWITDLVPRLAGAFPADPDQLAAPAAIGVVVARLVERGDVETACILASLVHRLAMTENRVEFQAGDALAALTGAGGSTGRAPADASTATHAPAGG